MTLPISMEVCPACAPKTATWCKGCPAEKTAHYVPSDITKALDVLIVSEPMVPFVPGPYLREAYNNHEALRDGAGRILRAVINEIPSKFPGGEKVRIDVAYAARCAGDEHNKDVFDRCRNYLVQVVKTASRGLNKPLVILALGAESVRSLGVKAKKLTDVQSRVLYGVDVEGTAVTVIPTISPAQLVGYAGYYGVFERDLARAVELSTTNTAPVKTLEELTKDYVFPKTLDEIQALVNHVQSYAVKGLTVEASPIAVDTETNTKFPHRAGAKMIAMSFAWDAGKAAAVALWHKDVGYDPAAAADLLRPLVEGAKIKVMHNAKFDMKVFGIYGWRVNNFMWDTMLAEHGLEEDKKGQYGLKQLTRALAPDFAAYADELHDQQEKLEGGNQLDNVRRNAATVIDDEPGIADASTRKKPKSKKSTKKTESDGGFENIELGTLLRYAAVDADMTWRLSMAQLKRFKVEEKSYREAKTKYSKAAAPVETKHNLPAQHAMQYVSLPAVPVLADMEYRGIRVDQKYLHELDAALTDIIEKSQRELYRIAAMPDLKLNSAASVANLLFNEGYLDPDTGKRVIHLPLTHTPTGQAQTTDKVLKALVARSGCKFSAQKLVYAKAYKAKNTFVANVRDLSAMDGFLHTNYNQHGTATYRLSSNDENMQNIPKKLAGHSIKKIFVPDSDDMLFVNADAKGAEVRIFTAYSKDKALIKSINDGFDTHCFIGAEIVKAVRRGDNASQVLEAIGLDDQYPLTYEDFDNRDKIKQNTPNYGEMLDKFRTAVKRVVFGILYGAAAPKIAETIGISEEQARQIIDLLFGLFPSIPQYMQSTKNELNIYKMVETYFGRRRRFNVAGAPNYMRSRAARQAINFKIQSTSSDIVIGCLTSINEPLKQDMGGRLLLTVHDSIGFQLPKKYARQLPEFIETYLVKQTAEKYPWLPVAFKWDFEVGPSYGELQSLDAWLAKHSPAVKPTDVIEEAYSDDDICGELRDEEAGS